MKNFSLSILWFAIPLCLSSFSGSYSSIYYTLTNHTTFHFNPPISKSNLSVKGIKTAQLKRTNIPNKATDPIRFSMQSLKQSVTVGEPIEITITAQLLDISPNLMFFLPGSNAYTLKLLTPEGFQITSSDLAEYTSDALIPSAKPLVTYRVRGYFTTSTYKSACFRLLRGPKHANSQSLFEERANLCVSIDKTSAIPVITNKGVPPTAGTISVLTSNSSLISHTMANLTTCAGSISAIDYSWDSGNNSITIKVTSSINNPQVKWSGASSIGWTNTFDIGGSVWLWAQTGMNAGNYTLSVRPQGDSGEGCSFDFSVPGSGRVYPGSGSGCSTLAPSLNTPNGTQVCDGSTVSLAAGGCAGTINWSNGQTGNSISVGAGTYTATCTANGCTSGSSAAVTITNCNTNPPSGGGSCVSFNETCSGNSQEIRSINVNVTSTGNYPLNITYRSPEKDVNGIVKVGSNSQTVFFSKTSNYITQVTAPVFLNAGPNIVELSSGVSGGYICFNQICIGDGGSGCSTLAPSLNTPNGTQVCDGSTVSLAAGGCAGTINWSNGQTGNSISVGAGTYTATCTANGCTSGSSAAVTITNCNTTPPGSPPSYFDWALPPVIGNPSQRLVASNGIVEVGLEPTVGGVISLFKETGQPNMLNNPYYLNQQNQGLDKGRQVQFSSYEGPRPFAPAGYNTRPGVNTQTLGAIGYNPVEGGGENNDPSQVLEWRQGNGITYVKSKPQQWLVDDYPAEYTIEKWVRLNGRAAEVFVKLTRNRSDATPYSASTQEWLCAYTGSKWHNIRGYEGSSPLTRDNNLMGRNAVNYPSFNTVHNEIFYLTEPWIATLDDNGRGLGIFTPDSYRFNSGRFFRTQQEGASETNNDNEYSDQAAYINGQPQVSFTSNQTVSYHRFALVAGNVDQIRDYVYANVPQTTPIRFNFRNGHALANNFYNGDGGLLGYTADGIKVDLSNIDANFTSQASNFKASSIGKIYIRAAFQGLTQFAFYYRKPGQSDLNALQNNQIFNVPVKNNGNLSDYEIDMVGKPGWDGIISQISIQHPYPHNRNADQNPVPGNPYIIVQHIDERGNPTY